MENKVILEVRTPRTGLETPEAMAQFFASLANIKVPSSLFNKREIPISFEITLVDQVIRFLIVAPSEYQSFMESQLLSQYPKAAIFQLKEDPVTKALQDTTQANYGQMKLQFNMLYPLKTFKEFQEVDPLSSLLGLLSKLDKEDIVLVQFLVIPVGSSWQKSGQKAIEQKNTPQTGTETPSDPLGLKTYSADVKEKISHAGLKVGVRLLVKSNNSSLLGLTSACFTGFNKPTGNSLKLSKPSFWQTNRFIKAVLERSTAFVPNHQLLNIMELATLYHYPGEKLATIQNVSWSKTILSDAPENLPIAINLTDEEKREINFFARTDFKNKPTTFGILRKDRRRHAYIIGKTGTGKSTLIANMAINDIRNREGVGIIDPHGELSETILEFIPSYRVNDVIFFNPADQDYPFHLNPLEFNDPGQKDLVASGIVAIFFKLYAHSWGPRLEYILRNVILTLLEVPNSTLMHVPELLTNQRFRNRAVSYVQDPVVKSFWVNEFDKMTDKLQSESISPILNKVGQFLSSQMIRNIVGSPKSTINLENIMNEGKILILSLSQGRMGEDNAALLGAMLITKLQLAAMSRVNIPEDQRRDFYLYVDEFQNFATTSFIKILSEARKYKLNLTLANQYIGQLEEGIRSAIFGNVGTTMSFLIGAEDAPIIAREFAEKFKPEDLLALGNFQMAMKMAINGLTSSPFLAQSLPLPNSKNQNKEKVIKVSRERYARPAKDKDRDREKSGGQNQAPMRQPTPQPVNQQPRGPEQHQQQRLPKGKPEPVQQAPKQVQLPAKPRVEQQQIEQQPQKEIVFENTEKPQE